MQSTIYRCDGPNCTKTKGEANKWLIGGYLSGNRSEVVFSRVVSVHQRNDWAYAIGPWNDHVAVASHHFCGQSCAMAKQNEFLQPQPEVPIG